MSNCPIVSAIARLLSSICDDVFIRLVNLNLIEQVGWQNLHHVVPDVNGHIFSCADIKRNRSDQSRGNVQTTHKECAGEADRGLLPHNVCKVWDVLIQVFVVQWGHYDVLCEK